jgi:hypothetical protein
MIVSSVAADGTQNRLTLIAKTTSNRVPGNESALRSTLRNRALPAAMCAALRRLARAMALADRSMAVILPLTSRSQISDIATPFPQPISRI